MVCPVYKAASTNWMKNIPRLSDMSVEKVAMLSRKNKNRQANTLARDIVPSRILPEADQHLGPLLQDVPSGHNQAVGLVRDKITMANNSHGGALKGVCTTKII